MADTIPVCSLCYNTEVRDSQSLHAQLYCEECDENLPMHSVIRSHLEQYKKWHRDAIEDHRDDNGVFSDRMAWINQQLVSRWKDQLARAQRFL